MFRLGKGPEFTVERAAQVAADLAPVSGLSMRQIKRVLLRVELALRCYQEVPLDVALFVALSFQGSNPTTLTKRLRLDQTPTVVGSALPRVQIDLIDQTPNRSLGAMTELSPMGRLSSDAYLSGGSISRGPTKPKSSYRSGVPFMRYRDINVEEVLRSNYPTHSVEWNELLVRCVKIGLGPWYIPEHQAMLDAVHHIVPD